MNAYRDCFLACKLIYRTYLLWKAPFPAVRAFHLRVAKKDLEISRAILNVERRRINA